MKLSLSCKLDSVGAYGFIKPISDIDNVSSIAVFRDSDALPCEKVIYYNSTYKRNGIIGQLSKLLRMLSVINNKYELVLKLGTKFKPEQIFRLLKESPKKWVISANSIKLVLKSLSFEWYLELLNDLKLLKLEEELEIKKIEK